MGRENDHSTVRREIDGVQVSAREHRRLLDGLASLVDDSALHLGAGFAPG